VTQYLKIEADYLKNVLAAASHLASSKELEDLRAHPSNSYIVSTVALFFAFSAA